MNARGPVACDFMHLWQPPKRAMRGTTFATLTARSRYLIARSRERFTRRADAFRQEHMLTMEVGRIDGIRFIRLPFIDTAATPDGE